MTDSGLYTGRVMHRRMMPMGYRFDYRVFSLLVDIDSIEAEAAGLRWLGFNRRGLMSLHLRDHGARDGSAWRSWVESLLAEAGIEDVGRIRLLCFPRVLGYTFNPLSVWYCDDRRGQPVALICEVSNTFGEQYHYLLHDHGAPLRWPVRAVVDKRFHVSPFINMNQQYRFRFSRPDEGLSIHINAFEDARLHLVASQHGRRADLTDRALARAFFLLPLMPLKVIALIHWQALKIWLRGGTYHPHRSSTDRKKRSPWPVKTPR